MIVGIDIRHLSARQSGGIAGYTVHLIDYLSKTFPDTTFKLFSTGKSSAVAEKIFKDRKNFVLKHINLPNRFLDPSFRFLKVPLIDRLMGGIDVFLSPHFLSTALSASCPRILIIHDLSFVRFPELFSWQDKLWHGLMDPKAQTQKADRIITVSMATKKDLMNIWKTPENKIKVVHSGIDQFFMDRAAHEGEREEIKTKYKLPGRFILALSAIEPRKNYVNLIKAFEILKNSDPKSSSNLSLVIAGPLTHRASDTVATAKRSPHKSEIIFTDFIDENDKPLVYDLAEIFVYPSLFEGFGFPPLEAMARGIPTIVSNRSSLPEIVGEAALSVDPYNISALADTMGRLLKDENARNFLKQKGISKAKEYDWNIAVGQIHSILEQEVGLKRNKIFAS